MAKAGVGGDSVSAGRRRPPKVSLVLADVGGTLVTEDKVLTERARAAVLALRGAGIRFAITSGRPPRGMAMLLEPLELDTPVAGFNGGLFVSPALDVLEERVLPRAVASQAIALIREHGLDPWVYSGTDWLITRPDAPHVAREAWTVRFQPTVATSLDPTLEEAVKIVGVSDDHAAVERCEAAVRSALGSRAAASRSQPYYLDVTHPDANKGAVVDYLSRTLGVPHEQIVTIGDGPNDTRMFERSGFGIAMGNASDGVRAAADAVTASYHDEGFAKAIDRYVLEPGAKP